MDVNSTDTPIFYVRIICVDHLNKREKLKEWFGVNELRDLFTRTDREENSKFIVLGWHFGAIRWKQNLRLNKKSVFINLMDLQMSEYGFNICVEYLVGSISNIERRDNRANLCSIYQTRLKTNNFWLNQRKFPKVFVPWKVSSRHLCIFK
jgi:hypothetical protein